MNAEQQALAQLHTRTYWPDDDTCVVVVGTRAGIEEQEYVEAEFVFQDGKLVQAHIGAAGEDCVAKTPQTQMFARDQLRALGL
jgi:hypothetical protein